MVSAAKIEYTPGEKRRDLGTYPKGRFTESDPHGGMLLDDSDSSVVAVVKSIMTKLAKSLAKGGVVDFLKNSAPAFIHLPKSYLSMIEKDMAYMEYFIREAMTQPDNHEWKIKNIALAQLVVLTTTVAQGSKTPLNPILGETITLHSESGTSLYCEQTSHHPPISHFLLEGPPDCAFRMYGYIETKVKLQGGGTQVHFSTPGKLTLELPEGSKYEMQQVESIIDGLLNTKKNLNPTGEIEVRDMTNMMIARTTFDCNAKKRKSGMMARFITGSDKLNKDGVYENRKDLIKLEIIQLSEDGDSELVDTGLGSYLEKIKFDNDEEPMWTINEEVHTTKWIKEPKEKLLVSDTYARPDLHFIIDQNWDEAESSKHELEEIQRRDKKLREKTLNE